MSSSPNTNFNYPKINHKLVKNLFISYLIISLLLVTGLGSILYTYSQNLLPIFPLYIWIASLAGIYIVCSVIFLIILYRKLNPLTEIIQNLYLFLDGYWENRIQTIRNDETGILAGGINTMSDEIVDLYVSLESQKEITSQLNKQIETISQPILLPFLKDALKILQEISFQEFETNGEKIIYQEILKLISEAGYPAYFWVFDKKDNVEIPGQVKNGLLMLTIPDQLTGFIKEEWLPLDKPAPNILDPEIVVKVSTIVLKSSDINDYLLNGTISIDEISPMFEWLPEKILKWATTSTLNTLAFFPICNQEEMKGFLVIGNRLGADDSFAPYILESFQILVEALNLVNNDLVFRKQSLSEMVEMKSTVSAVMSIGESNNLPKAYELTNQIICDLFRPDYLSIISVEKQTRNLKVEYSYSESELLDSEIRPIDRELVSYLIQTSEPLILLDGYSSFMVDKGISYPNFSNWVGIPLRYKNDILGAIVFQDSSKQIIPDEHIMVFELLANQLAMILQESRLRAFIDYVKKAELISENILRSTDPEEMMEIALRELNQVLEIEKSQLLIHQFGTPVSSK